MFEHFTERAIKSIVSAQDEARELNHPILYPEHLLIGIVNQKSGITTRFLRVAGVSAEKIREEVKELYAGKQTDKMPEVLPFSADVKNVLKKTWDKTRKRGINYILPEHLFLTLIETDKTPVSILLNKFDMDLNRIKESVIRVTEKKAKKIAHPEGLNKTSSASKYYSIPAITEEKELIDILNNAKEKLELINKENLGTEQILLAMLENRTTNLAETLAKHNITYESFQEKLNQLSSRAIEYNSNEYQFTPKAFTAINSAFLLSKEVGSTSILSEHILLSILKNKSGLAYSIIKDLGIDAEELYSEIIKPIEKEKPVALTIIKLAKEEARRLGLNVVGTELILIGILAESYGIGAKVLQDLGITLKDARKEVEKIIGFGDEYLEQEIELTPRAQKLLEIAQLKAQKYKREQIESEHLLYGITEVKDCIALKILEKLGVDSLEIKQGISQELNVEIES